MNNKSQPIEIAKAKGTLRPSRYPSAEESIIIPECFDGIPRPPESLGETGKEVWTELLKQLLPIPGLVAPVDLRLLEQYCWHIQKMQEFDLNITVNGNFINYNGKTIPNPALSEYRQSEKAVRDIGVLFGLNPSSRSTIRIIKPPKDKGKFGGVKL